MKALLIRFGSLGDILLTFPVLGDLEASGAREIHYLTRDEYRDLLEPLPGIERIWTLPRGAPLSELRRLGRELKAEGFDLVLDLHANLRSRMLRRFMAAARVGASRAPSPHPRWQETRRYDLKRRLLVLAARWTRGRPAGLTSPPVALRHRESLAQTLGPTYREAPFSPYPIDAAIAASVMTELADQGLDGEARPVAIAPGAAWPSKVWPRYRELAAALAGRVPLLLLGGAAESAFCQELAAEGLALAYCGNRPLPRVAAALARCRLLVTGDTGLGHMAEALGLPVLVLFGPTVPAFGFAPRGPRSRILERPLSCRPCSLHGERDCRYGHLDCLADIEVDAVLAALADMDPELR